MPAIETKIWRQDPASGQWKQAKACDPSTAHQWLVSLRQEYPEATFKISPTRPKD